MKSLFTFGSLAVIAIAMASCAKTDLYDENSEILISSHKTDYEANFVKKYGEVDPNKSWDMSSNEPRYSLTPIDEASKASTRTAPYTQTTSTAIVEQSTLQWFFQNTPAGKNNRKKGDPFYVDIAEGSFTIVPIFQGNASYYWELWMHVDGISEDIQIWKKGDDLKYRETDGGELKTVGTEQAGIPRNAFQVSAPAITFSGLPKGNMYFYLRMWKSTDKYTNDIEKSHYTQLSSLNQKMIVLKDFAKPSCVPSDDVSYKIIGCEDANDNDYEDLAFLIYGNFGINEPVKVYEEIPKRYMVEDLGSTDDFDFNDVVVDVWNRYETIYEYELIDGERTLVNTTGPTLIKQWAIVRAAGGTIDFTIKIGNSTTWTKSQHVDPVTTMVNTGRDGAINYVDKIIDKFDIENMDWDSANNNIKIEVDGRGKNLGVYNIPFPKKGEIPMILAVDPSVNWMLERDGVPKSWIDNTKPEHKEADYPD